MTRPAVFFDRDNTLIISDGYLGDAAQVVLVDGAATAIARVRALGYAVVTVSNQSGVARGYFDEAAVRAVNARMDQLLAAREPGATIDRHEYCPYHPDAPVERYRRDTDLRKPGAGMLREAAKAMDLDLAQSWMVGDAARDVEAGAAAGCRTILLRDPKLPPSPAAKASSAVKPDFVAGSLTEAAEIIARHPPADPGAPPPKAPKPAPAPAKASAPAAADDDEKPRLETLLEQILYELRHSHERAQADFSVSKLFAGIIQIAALAVLFYAYLQRSDPNLGPILLVALTLQTFTIALLIMGQQR